LQTKYRNNKNMLQWSIWSTFKIQTRSMLPNSSRRHCRVYHCTMHICLYTFSIGTAYCHSVMFNVGYKICLVMTTNFAVKSFEGYCMLLLAHRVHSTIRNYIKLAS